MATEHNCFINPYCSCVLSDDLYPIHSISIIRLIESSICNCTIYCCNKVRYRVEIYKNVSVWRIYLHVHGEAGVCGNEGADESLISQKHKHSGSPCVYIR